MITDNMTALEKLGILGMSSTSLLDAELEKTVDAGLVIEADIASIEAGNGAAERLHEHNQLECFEEEIPTTGKDEADTGMDVEDKPCVAAEIDSIVGGAMQDTISTPKASKLLSEAEGSAQEEHPSVVREATVPGSVPHSDTRVVAGASGPGGNNGAFGLFGEKYTKSTYPLRLTALSPLNPLNPWYVTKQISSSIDSLGSQSPSPLSPIVFVSDSYPLSISVSPMKNLHMKIAFFKSFLYYLHMKLQRFLSGGPPDFSNKRSLGAIGDARISSLVLENDERQRNVRQKLEELVAADSLKCQVGRIVFFISLYHIRYTHRD